MTDNKIIGKIGEDIAAKWLVSRRHKIVERNYFKKWGEIDIISLLGDVVHFVEVKSVSYETMSDLEYAVSHETWRPEDKVRNDKLCRIARVIETWLTSSNYNGKFQIDVIAVKIVSREKYARVKIIENIIID